jgi:3',5'-cyclic AMP phosphodiesterase CpdA
MEQSVAAQADFSFVHFTDTHIMAGGTYGEHRLDTTVCLRRVIAVLNVLEPRPVFAVIGGDLVSPDLLDRSRTLTPEEYEPSYHLLLDVLGMLQCPAYLLLGNHDHRVAFHRVMKHRVPAPDAPHYYSFGYQGYHFVALDSHQPGEPGGYLEASQLAWLQADLDAHRHQPTLVFVHHHPWPLGLAWIDAMGLRNGESLVAVLKQYPEVRGIVCGHVHLDQMIQRDGLTMLTTPATCFQISKLSQTRKILPGPPGFRLIHIKAGELSTRVFHLPADGIAGL